MTSGRRSLTPTLSLAPSLGERLRRRGRIARRALIAGYTVVEVMMAMAVLSIGATGVIAMQKTALLGNLRARNLATASAIASAWVERLRIDGVRWTIDGAGVNTIAATTIAEMTSTTTLSQRTMTKASLRFHERRAAPRAWRAN